MDTQNRTGCRRSVRRQLLAGLTLLLPVALYAQGPVTTNATRARQAADQLVAMTKPGYYTSRLVPDWRKRGQDQTQAIAVVAGLCERSRSTSTVVPSLHFTGDRLDAEQVQLVWDVKQAAVGVDFDIERSQEATSGFEPVLVVKSWGAVSAAETYQTIDANRSAEFSYYRIKWVDLTGAQAYSSVIAVKGERPRFTVQAFPNPGSQKTMAFALTGSEPDKPLAMTIYDVQGRVLYQHSQAVPNSAHQLTLPNSVDFPAGLYYARIVDGQQAVSTPFIIQP